MMNQIPSKVNSRLITSFGLAHHVPPDTCTWFSLFSIVYVYKPTDKNQDPTTFQSNNMIGIAVGRSTKINALSVYNPIDPSRLPRNKFPSRIHYDGGLVADIYRHSHNNITEPYCPGMPIRLLSHDNNLADYTTTIISSIPIRTAKDNTVHITYLLQHHAISTITNTLMEMNKLVGFPIKTPALLSPRLSLLSTTFPHTWLQHSKKVTYNHGGKFQKGSIAITADGTARFSCRRQKSSKSECWGVALPNLVMEWPSLNCNHILQPKWNISSFLSSSTTAQTSAFSIFASHVSARNIKALCPPPLYKALHEDFADYLTWHESYMEEKNELIANNTCVKISLQEYHRLCRLPKAVPKALPSMSVMSFFLPARRWKNRQTDGNRKAHNPASRTAYVRY